MRTWLLRLVQWIATILVTWFIMARVGLGLDELRALDPALWVPDHPGLLLLSAVLLLLGYFASAALWGRIVVDLGGPVLELPDRVRLFMIANLGRYVPGKVWQIAGLAVLSRGKGVSAGVATGAAVVGQGVAVTAATLVGLGAILGRGGPSPWAAALALALVLAVAAGLTPPVFRIVTRLWFRLARTEPPAGLSSASALGWLGLYLANWVLYAGAFWVMVRSFGVHAPPVPVASAFAAAYVLGYLMIFAPAGLGVREGFLTALLSPHVGAAPAAAMAVLARVWTTLVEVVPAAAFWTRHLTSREGAADGE